MDWRGSRRELLSAAAAATAVIALPTRARSGDVITVGVVPNLSARALIEAYQPLRDHLSRSLGRSVEVVTAPDFGQYFARMVRGEFDITIAAPHLARLAQVDHGVRPALLFEPAIQCYLVQLSRAPVVELQRLRGGKIAFAAPASLVAMRGRQYFAENRLPVGEALTVVRPRNEDTAALLLSRGDVQCVVMSSNEWRSVPTAVRDQLSIFRQFGEVPAFVVGFGAELDRAIATKLVEALHGIYRLPSGAELAARTGFSAIRPIVNDDLVGLDSLLPQVRELLLA